MNLGFETDVTVGTFTFQRGIEYYNSERSEHATYLNTTTSARRIIRVSTRGEGDRV